MYMYIYIHIYTCIYVGQAGRCVCGCVCVRACECVRGRASVCVRVCRCQLFATIPARITAHARCCAISRHMNKPQHASTCISNHTPNTALEYMQIFLAAH